MENENKNQKEAENRFKKREKDTLDQVIIGGKRFATGILDKIKSTIYTQEEKQAILSKSKEKSNEIQEQEKE